MQKERRRKRTYRKLMQTISEDRGDFITSFEKDGYFLQAEERTYYQLERTVQKIADRITRKYAAGTADYEDYVEVVASCRILILSAMHHMFRLMRQQESDRREEKQNTISQIAEEIPVSVSAEEGLLHIRMPNTVISSRKHASLLPKFIRIALDAFEMEHGGVTGIVSPPAFFVVKRKCAEAGSVEDNDNLEMMKTVNLICQKLHFSDNVNNMTYVSSFELVEKEEENGTDIFVFSESDFDRYGNLIRPIR